MSSAEPGRVIAHPDITGVTGDILHIENIVIEPEYRRLGVGTMLAKLMARDAERVGVKHVTLVPMNIGKG